ncbi:hypothetical protein CH302_10980 [Rhodococcus sp. 15-2388-1-1a]|nr:hypothetical protein CH302_10980 [Rhodococcus sp. 15-2388-1-1a]
MRGANAGTGRIEQDKDSRASCEEATVTTKDKAAPRSYGQACPLATAMDLLGERWTLLVVRELLLGPKKFGELGVRLAAAGPNRLSSRLDRLREAGAIEKTAAGAYTLTDFGEGLRQPVIGLAMWGLGLMQGGVDALEPRPDVIALVLTTLVSADALDGLDVTCQVQSGDDFVIDVQDGRMTVVSGRTDDPDCAHLMCSTATFIQLVSDSTTLDSAIAHGDAQIADETGDVHTLMTVLGTTVAAIRAIST